MKYERRKIADLLDCIIDNRGKTPPISDNGYCLLEINCIAEKRKYPNYTLIKKHVSEETYRSWFRSGHPQKGDILIPTVGTLDAISVMDRDDCCIAQNMIAFRVNSSICDNEYLYYVLCDPTVRKHLLNLDIGGVQPSIKVPHIKNMEINIPPLNVQKQISSILCAIDEKLQINNNFNDNLQQQLQSIYHLMFDKTSQNGVPEKHLSEICSYSQRRIAVSSLTLESYYSTENMLPGKAGAVAASSLPTTTQTIGCKNGDVLVSNIRPYFKKIVYCQSECGCSTDVLCFVPKAPDYSLYLFNTLYDDHFFDYMMAGSKGTKMPRGDKQQIMTYPVVLPSPVQLAEFNAIAKPILEEIENRRQENKRLASMRDVLLPKLMSGEIDVSRVAF